MDTLFVHNIANKQNAFVGNFTVKNANMLDFFKINLYFLRVGDIMHISERL